MAGEVATSLFMFENLEKGKTGWTFVFRILSIPAEWLLSGCRPCGNIPSPGEPESCDGGEAAGCPCQGERAPGDRRPPLA